MKAEVQRKQFQDAFRRTLENRIFFVFFYLLSRFCQVFGFKGWKIAFLTFFCLDIAVCTYKSTDRSRITVICQGIYEAGKGSFTMSDLEE